MGEPALHLYGFPFSVFFLFFHFSLFELKYIYIVVGFSDPGPSVSLQCFFYFLFFLTILLLASVEWFNSSPSLSCLGLAL